MIMILKKIKTKNGLKNRKRRTALTIARLYLMSQENEFYILKQLKKQKKTKAKKQTKSQPNRVISQNVCNRGKICWRLKKTRGMQSKPRDPYRKWLNRGTSFQTYSQPFLLYQWRHRKRCYIKKVDISPVLHRLPVHPDELHAHVYFMSPLTHMACSAHWCLTQ